MIVECLIKFFERRGLTGSQILEGDSLDRKGDLFQGDCSCYKKIR